MDTDPKKTENIENITKIATFNTNSIRSRLHIILPWLIEKNVDALCLQEIKVENKNFPLSEFENIGYKAYFSGMKSYNGVAIIAKEAMEDIRVGLEDQENSPEDSARLISGIYKGIQIINCYVPQGKEIENPSYQYKLNWFTRLGALLNAKFKNNLPVLLCGDLNVAPEWEDVYEPEKLADHVCFHIDVRNAFKSIIELGLIDLFRKFHPNEKQYTFFDYRAPWLLKKNKGWRIDHILVTPELAEKSIFCEIDMEPRFKEKPSDHTFLVGGFGG